MSPDAGTSAATRLPPRWPLRRGAPDRRMLLCYHRGCHDGALAAALLAERMRAEGTRFDLVPLEAGRAPSRRKAAGRDVVLLDLCPDLPALRGLCQAAASVFVLDHHLAAEPVAAAMPDVVFLAEGRCGALLCWQMLHGDVPPPAYVQLVDDVDHYRQDDPDVRALAVLVRGAATPARAEALRRRFEAEPTAVLAEAHEESSGWQQRVADYAGRAAPAWLEGVRVRVVELAARDGALASDVGNAVASLHGGVALVFRRAGGRVRHSLRSRPGIGPAVHDLAARFGGGGHRHAAGMVSDEILHQTDNAQTDNAQPAEAQPGDADRTNRASSGSTPERQRDPENKP